MHSGRDTLFLILTSFICCSTEWMVYVVGTTIRVVQPTSYTPCYSILLYFTICTFIWYSMTWSDYKQFFIHSFNRIKPINWNMRTLLYSPLSLIIDILWSKRNIFLADFMHFFLRSYLCVLVVLHTWAGGGRRDLWTTIVSATATTTAALVSFSPVMKRLLGYSSGCPQLWKVDWSNPIVLYSFQIHSAGGVVHRKVWWIFVACMRGM